MIGLSLGLMASRPAAAAAQPAALLDYSLLAGSLPAGMLLTRASQGWYFDASGVLQFAGVDVSRFDYAAGTVQGLLVEPQFINALRNSSMSGAVAGTPGALPTNWTFAAGSTGIASQVVGLATESGLPCIDVRFYGTAASTSSFSLRFDAGNVIASLPGQVWTLSSFSKIVAGSTAGISAISHLFVENKTGGSFATSGTTAFVPSSSLQRFAAARTLTDATGVFVTGGISVVVLSGQSVDITLRIGLPQLGQGAIATSPVPTSGSAATREADIATIALPQTADVLVQDRAGAYWADAQAAGSCTLTPRTGMRHIARVRAWAAGALNAGQKAALAVAA